MLSFILLVVGVTASIVPDAPLSGGEFIVVLKSAKEKSLFEFEFAAENIGYAKSFNIGSQFQAYLFKNISASIVETIRSHPSVKYVEANGEVRIAQETQPNPPSWGLKRASQRFLPMEDVYTYPSSAGEGVRAYIVDTGIYRSHSDFGTPSRVEFGITTNHNGGDDDCNGHGTHVAGTVGGDAYGIAKKATLVHVKVLGCLGSGTFAQVIEGIEWCARDNRERGATGVINLSLGGSSSQAVNDAVDGATAAGIISAVAAGNDFGRNACLVSPAGAETAYTVAASNINDGPALFTNLGECVNIWAPGANIVSAWIGSPTATRTLSGTSMSAPHVAGVAALILGESSTQMSPQQVMDALTSTATPDIINRNPDLTPNLNLFNGATLQASASA